MKVESWPIEQAKRYSGNPRRNDHAVDALARSLAKFGWKQPIVVDGEETVETRAVVGQVAPAERIAVDHPADVLSLLEEQANAVRNDPIADAVEKGSNPRLSHQLRTACDGSERQ